MFDYGGSLARVSFQRSSKEAQRDIVVPNLFSKSPLTDHHSIYYIMALNRVIVKARRSLMINSVFQRCRCLATRGLSTQVDDHVTGITEEQKQVGDQLE